MSPSRSEHGFTLIEVLIVVSLIGLVTAMAVPMTESGLAAYRLPSDARAIVQNLSLAKMRAAARFTRARLYIDRGTSSYFMQVWDRTGNNWVTEGPVARLSRRVSFGFGGLGTPPPNTQVAIGFSPECRADDGQVIANTSCIVFNSRGIPIDAAGAPTGGGGFYLTDGALVFGTTITATPLIRLWRTPAAAALWLEE